ncbi:MAG: hypothetical protein ABIP79_14000, partial [Chitinophagaceae bacterium]
MKKGLTLASKYKDNTLPDVLCDSTIDEKPLHEVLCDRLRERCMEKIEARLSKKPKILDERYEPCNWHGFNPQIVRFYASKWFILLVLFVVSSPFLAYLLFLVMNLIAAGVLSLVIISTAIWFIGHIFMYRYRPTALVYFIKHYEINPSTTIDTELHTESMDDYHFNKFLDAYIEHTSEYIAMHCVIDTV